MSRGASTWSSCRDASYIAVRYSCMHHAWRIWFLCCIYLFIYFFVIKIWSGKPFYTFWWIKFHSPKFNYIIKIQPCCIVQIDFPCQCNIVLCTTYILLQNLQLKKYQIWTWIPLAYMASQIGYISDKLSLSSMKLSFTIQKLFCLFFGVFFQPINWVVEKPKFFNQ